MRWYEFWKKMKLLNENKHDHLTYQEIFLPKLTNCLLSFPSFRTPVISIMINAAFGYIFDHNSYQIPLKGCY